MNEIARKTHADAIDRVHTFATDATFGTRLNRDVRTRLEHLHANWKGFQEAHFEIMKDLNDDTERAPHLDILVEAENQFLTADAIMQERLAQSQSDGDHESNDSDNDDDQGDSSQNNGNQQTTVPPTVQAGQIPIIPQTMLQMPWHFRIENIWGEFNGDKKKWQAFHDSFKSRVYDDPSMPAVQKFQILRAALKGKAEKALGEWQIADRNFEPAWQRLKELYDDPYATSKELLQRIFSMEKLDYPHGTKLQIMSNVTQETSRQLKALDYPAEHFDMVFIHAVQAKLDQETSVKWDLQETEMSVQH